MMNCVHLQLLLFLLPILQFSSCEYTQCYFSDFVGGSESILPNKCSGDYAKYILKRYDRFPGIPRQNGSSDLFLAPENQKTSCSESKRFSVTAGSEITVNLLSSTNFAIFAFDYDQFSIVASKVEQFSGAPAWREISVKIDRNVQNMGFLVYGGEMKSDSIVAIDWIMIKNSISQDCRKPEGVTSQIDVFNEGVYKNFPYLCSGDYGELRVGLYSQNPSIPLNSSFGNGFLTTNPTKHTCMNSKRYSLKKGTLIKFTMFTENPMGAALSTITLWDYDNLRQQVASKIYPIMNNKNWQEVVVEVPRDVGNLVIQLFCENLTPRRAFLGIGRFEIKY